MLVLKRIFSCRFHQLQLQLQLQTCSGDDGDVHDVEFSLEEYATCL